MKIYPFNEIELARVLRASLTHHLVRMVVLRGEIAQLRMEIRDATAIRAHVRAASAMRE